MKVSKKKCFHVVLVDDNGLTDMMTVAGCQDEEECIKFANRAKGKDYKIYELQELRSHNATE